MSNNYGYGQNQHGPYGPYQPAQTPPPPPRKSRGGKVVGIVVAVCIAGIVLVGGCTALMFDGAIDAGKADSAPQVQPPKSEPGPAVPTPKPTTKPTPPPVTTTPEPTPEPKPSMTASQEQAVGTAEDYLRYQSFSKQGLIDQLVFEGFSTKDATFAVGHITVDWNEQAAKKAKEYLTSQHFSRAGLIDQLEFEGFTAKQAAYGVSKAGL